MIHCGYVILEEHLIMETPISTHPAKCRTTLSVFFLNLLPLTGTYFFIEFCSFLLLKPENPFGLIFGFLWAILLSSAALLLPRLGGRIFFGVTYYFMAIWTIAQSGYDQVFSKMMWLSTMFLAGEGAGYMKEILADFSPLWWGSLVLSLALGGILIWKFPKSFKVPVRRLTYLAPAAVCIICLCFLPELIFLKDKDVWGTRSEYGQSSSLRATYNTMYDAKSVYDICGIYQVTFRDLWKNEIYPLTPAYRHSIESQTEEIDQYFEARGPHSSNEMTGVFAGKNVILVLMESMDDWLITPEDTPTLTKLMNEGMNFTQFYSPGYGSVRTLNTEFCMNTGIYLPTTGHFVFDYVTNDFNESIASQLNANGYTSECFHYNTPEFYSRGVIEPAIGYGTYNSYGNYVTDDNQLYDECLLYKIPELMDLFFREGPTLNTIITRSAHLSYVYNEVLSHYALKQYPEYRGKYGSEEEDCARVKAKLVDDFFAQLLDELEKHGQLNNTVIIGITDHYTYGYKNMDELFAHSGVDEELLLEKTPFFIWSPDGPKMEITKTMNTSDVLPTVLNLLGIDSPYSYIGQDGFDPDYEGYAIFPDGSWISNGIVIKKKTGGEPVILRNPNNIKIDEAYIKGMEQKVQPYIHIGNLLLTSNYYS